MKSTVNVTTVVEIKVIRIYRNRTVMVQDPDGRHLLLHEGDTLMVQAKYDQQIGS